MVSNSLFQKVSLKTGRLTVRTIDTTDAEELHAVVCQPRVLAFLPEDVMTLEEVRDIIRWLQGCYLENRPEKIRKWTLGIEWDLTSEIIGWCGLGPLDFSPEEIEIFCGLSESYWGKGIAVEACEAVLDYAFQNIGLEKIVAVVDPENRQSVRLIEKLGMRYEKQVNGLPEEFHHYEGFRYYSITG